MSRLLSGPVVKRTLLEAVIICALAVAVGLSLNFKVVFNAFSGHTLTNHRGVMETLGEAFRTPPQDAAEALPFPVGLEEIDGLLAGGAVLVDARNVAAYNRSHLPGAISLPLADLEGKLSTFIRAVPTDKTVITYCSGYGCPDSFTLAARLLQAGYTDVLVYEGGVPEWRAEQRSLESGE